MKQRRSWQEVAGIDALNYPVPAHANTIWYSLGGITLCSLIIAFLSGAVLTQFYNPTPAAAHDSVRFMSEAPLVGLVRGIHYWSANIGFGLLIIHVLRVIFTGAYRAPRTVNYLVGVLLFSTVFMLYFSGTVLRWDQEAYEALEHFLETMKLLGPLGSFFSEEFTLSTSLLARMYGLHVGILSGAFIILAVVHLAYVKHFGISPKPGQTPEEYEKSKVSGHTFLLHMRKLTGYGLILFAVVVGLSYFLTPGLLNAPVPGVESTKPPWPFWYFYPLEGIMGISGILLGSLAVVLALLVIPSLGLIISSERKRILVGRIIAGAGLVIWLTLLVITYFLPVMKHF
jgi:quinol-cytochrome oxidoreductase complex cytochrome b subunit